MVAFVDDDGTYYEDSLGRVVWFDAGACPIEIGKLTDADAKAGEYNLQWMEETFIVDGRLANWRRSAHGMPLKLGRMARYAR